MFLASLITILLLSLLVVHNSAAAPSKLNLSLSAECDGNKMHGKILEDGKPSKFVKSIQILDKTDSLVDIIGLNDGKFMLSNYQNFPKIKVKINYNENVILDLKCDPQKIVKEIQTTEAENTKPDKKSAKSTTPIKKAKPIKPINLLVTPKELGTNWKVSDITSSKVLEMDSPFRYVASALYTQIDSADSVLVMVSEAAPNTPITVINEIPDTDDKMVFPFDNTGKCDKTTSENPLISFETDSLSQTLQCSYGNFHFDVWSIGKTDHSHFFMDKMLGKLYKSQGKKIGFSTEELAKTGKIIPKREMTYEEKISSLVAVQVIDCSERGSYVIWKGSITSFYSEPIDVHLVLTGKDSKGKIITFEKELILDLYPDQTQYIDRMLDDVSDFNTCGYQIESITPSR